MPAVHINLSVAASRRFSFAWFLPSGGYKEILAVIAATLSARSIDRVGYRDYFNICNLGISNLMWKDILNLLISARP